MEAKKFGQFIAGIRKEKKMTQAELAEKIHVTWISGYPDIRTTGTGTWNFGTGIDAF